MESRNEKIDRVGRLAMQLRNIASEFNALSEEITQGGGKVSVKLASGGALSPSGFRAIDVDVSVVFEV